MALESKTLLNDVGSAVLVETVSQLNRAQSVTPLTVQVLPSAVAGSAGGAAAGDVAMADGQGSSGILFTSHEDCFVTSIRMCTVDARFGVTAPLATSLVIVKLPAPTWQNGLDATVDRQINAGGVHGNAGLIALGAAPCTYEVLFCSNGSPFTAGNGCDDGQVFDLASLPASVGCQDDDFNGTLIAVDHLATNAVSLPPNGFSMNAGETLVWGIMNATGAAIQIMFSVGYRPVKDALTLQPAFTPAMTKFKSVAR